jgi:hypothetical protein
MQVSVVMHFSFDKIFLFVQIFGKNQCFGHSVWMRINRAGEGGGIEKEEAEGKGRRKGWRIDSVPKGGGKGGGLGATSGGPRPSQVPAIAAQWSKRN